MRKEEMVCAFAQRMWISAIVRLWKIRYSYCIYEFVLVWTGERRNDLNNLELQKLANEVRKGIIVSINEAGSGHPGGSLSCTDILTYLYFEEMNVDPAKPADPQRDRFVLSKGHAAPALYSVLAQRGYFPVEQLKTLRKLHSDLQGHPSMHHLPGLEMSTGSLGQGFSAAVGMALASKMDKADWRVYSILGDGEIQEGEVWEAAMLASNHALNNLVIVVDNNNLQIDGAITDVNSPYPIDEKFRAFRWHVINVDDGHDFDKIRAAYQKARRVTDKPVCIVAKTLKGKGVSFMENQAGWHGKSTNAEEFKVAMQDLERIGEALCHR